MHFLHDMPLSRYGAALHDRTPAQAALAGAPPIN